MVFERNDEMPGGMDGVYDWVGQFRFSRPVKNIPRDFSDAVLLAEIVAQLVPAWVQLHNYPSAHRFQQKLNNWETLNRKVLTRLKCGISHKHQEDIANAVPGAIELLLIQVKRATANSPYLQAKHATPTHYDVSSASPRSNSSTTCPPPSTPPGKQKPISTSKATGGTIDTDELSHEDGSVTTSFSKLLQMMSDTTEKFEEVIKPIQAKTRSRANTAPTIRLNSQIRKTTNRPLTPNYAKPTLSTMAMARPASVDAISRLPQGSPFVFPQKNNELSKPSLADKIQVVLEEDKKHLPSDTNEFQVGSFVYFLSSEEVPTVFSVGDPEDQAQVARVIKTLPSGECTLRLYRRVLPEDSTNDRTRCYFVTPHSIDCCSTLLHTIPNMTFDPETNIYEWQVRPRILNTSINNGKDDRTKSDQNTSPPQRHFFTEVLTRVTFTSAKLAEPISQTTQSVSLGVCFPCPRFAESFRVPIEPTIFPKVQVSLVVEIPERFPQRNL